MCLFPFLQISVGYFCFRYRKPVKRLLPGTTVLEEKLLVLVPDPTYCIVQYSHIYCIKYSLYNFNCHPLDRLSCTVFTVAPKVQYKFLQRTVDFVGVTIEIVKAVQYVCIGGLYCTVLDRLTVTDGIFDRFSNLQYSTEMHQNIKRDK